jgi:hypothetical protein
MEDTNTPVIESEVSEQIANNTLTQSIEAALNPLGENAPEPVPDTPAAEPEKAEISVEPVVEETPKTQSEAELALQFYRALQDPNAAPAMVEFLAKQVGLNVQPTIKAAPETPEPSIQDLITKELGEEYGFIAPKLGSAIEKVLGKFIEPLRAEQQKIAAVNEYDKAVAKLNAQTGGDFQKLEPEIVKAMEVLRPSDKATTEQYLSYLYKTVKGQNIQQVTQQAATKVVEKIQRNASEASPSPSAATDSRVIDGPSMPTLDQAIAAAVKGMQFK